MDKELILFDKGEVILFVPNKRGYSRFSLTYADFNRIQFDKCVERKFGFIKQDSEKIILSSSKLPGMVEYTRGQNKLHFDKYKEQFAKFAHEYRVTFTDNTK